MNVQAVGYGVADKIYDAGEALKEYLGKKAETVIEKVPGLYIPGRVLLSSMRTPGIVDFGLTVNGNPPRSRIQIEEDEKKAEQGLQTIAH